MELNELMDGLGRIDLSENVLWGTLMEGREEGRRVQQDTLRIWFWAKEQYGRSYPVLCGGLRSHTYFENEKPYKF